MDACIVIFIYTYTTYKNTYLGELFKKPSLLVLFFGMIDWIIDSMFYESSMNRHYIILLTATRLK